MKYYNKIDENGLYTGVTCVQRKGFNYTEIPVKPICASDNETATFDFENNKWDYNFEKMIEKVDSPYYTVNYMPSTLYTSNIRPQCGSIVLEKSEDISVLIPCYNKAEFILAAVESCVNQTMKPTHIIVLLMDDDSIAMKDELESVDSIVTCIVRERLNVCASRTALVNEYCPTEWFVLLDADDMLKENFIEEVYKEESSVSFGKVQKVNITGELGNYPDILQFIDGYKGHPFGCIDGNLTSLMSKQVFNEIGLDEALCNGGEDFDFILRLFAQKKYKVSQSHRTCYYYRYSDGISLKPEFFESHFESVKKNLEFLHEEYVAIKGYSEFENDFYNRPMLETFASGTKNGFDTLFETKENIIKVKQNNSKLKEPLDVYSKEQFTYVGNNNVVINDFDYINKTFDVLFLVELTKDVIFDDNIEMIINKDILPEIEDKGAYEKLIYLLDNYACFVQKSPVKVEDNEILEAKVRDINDETGIFDKEIYLLDIDKKEYGTNDDRIVEMHFALHHECNLNCPYCCQGLEKCNKYSDEEIFKNFDTALTYFENNLKKSKIKIRLLGGEPTIWSDELITKIMDRLKDYRVVDLFTNNTNKDSLWYKYDKIYAITHIVDWKEHPEKIQIDNMLRNQELNIVITHDDIEDLDQTLSNINYHRQISIQPCINSPDPSLNTTKDDVARLKDIVDKYELPVITTCSMGIIEFDCETMLGKPCCRGSHNCYYPIEKLVEMFNNMKFNMNEICKYCVYAELFDNDSSEESTQTDN